MSGKRSRTTYEADLQAQQSPFVFFGTPLPPLGRDVRDDGSYVPTWKQEVRDERGRKRLHGAFTGGFSAGYFNTVGSKEGWTPSTFVSSRSNRRKDDPGATQQRPEDFMDEEDLAEAEESRKLQTSRAFAGLGSTEDDAARSSTLAGLFRPEGDNMGTRLLRKMGWKEGQGIGPKVRRLARLGLDSERAVVDDGRGSHLFAPEDVGMIRFVRKTDLKGLGYAGEARLAPPQPQRAADQTVQSDDEEEDDSGILGPSRPVSLFARKKNEKKRGGIGLGVLNDTGSDDEDPYEFGPRISYNRVIGGDKKKKRKELNATTSSNPSLKSRPVFLSKTKSNALSKVGTGLKKCHDGRLPLDGFVFGTHPDPLVSESTSVGKYPPPKVPPDWKSSKTPLPANEASSEYVSTADAAKASKLDPKSRAAILGEKQLPGKSVFDFISAAARERLVSATGNSNLPEAKGEIPVEYAMSTSEKLAELLKGVPSLDKESATAAIARGAGGGGPYADNEAKRSRYRSYLEHQAGFAPSLPPKPPGMTDDVWLREFHEFFNCARIFKPMSGFMASRFTTSTNAAAALPSRASNGQGENVDLITKAPPKQADPAEEAAKLGMYGPLTRSSHDFYPTRLLCKRFNVKPPANIQPDADADSSFRPSKPSASQSAAMFGYDLPPSRALLDVDHASNPGIVAQPAEPTSTGNGGALPQSVDGDKDAERPPDTLVDTTRNDALEGVRAGEDVFKAIFGDSSDEE